MTNAEEQLISLQRETDSLRRQLDALRGLEKLQERPGLPSPEAEFLRQQLEALRQMQSLQQRLESLLKSEVLPRAEDDTPGTRAGGPPTSIRSSLVARVKRWLRGTLDRMSDEEVMRAVEAQSPAETIAEILAATPPASAAAENGWAELLLRGAEAKRRVAELAGGVLSSSEAATVLGISVQGVKQRMERDKLLAVPLSGGQWGFPALQFALNGRVRPGVPEVTRAGAHVDPWTVLSILVDDAPDGSGILLERLDDPAVLGDVLHRLETYGEHVAA